MTKLNQYVSYIYLVPLRLLVRKTHRIYLENNQEADLILISENATTGGKTGWRIKRYVFLWKI